MRWLIFYILVCLILPFQVTANDDKPVEAETVNPETTEDSEIREEDKELIAELELIELLDLLENMNALASMEDTE